MIPAIVFDDGQGELAPLSDLRPAYAIRTGAYTSLERIALLLHLEAGARIQGLWTPPRMRALAAESASAPVNDLSGFRNGDDGIILVNGRCPAPPEGFASLALGTALLDEDGAVVAARLTRADTEHMLTTGELPPGIPGERAAGHCLLKWPWDVIRFRDECLDIDLDALLERATQELPPGVVAIADENIRISPDALIYPTVVLDAGDGPIVIDDHAVIRPGAIIIGPAYIGPGSTVLDRSLIKAHSAIGPVCKVAGEVGGTIFQGFANKAHDGHLGDAWVGEWANLGAGTTNSNLLNTYGEVIAQARPDGKRIRTGLQFLGCIIGDHVKTAIMTRIMTGSIFGTGSMVAAATPPTTLGRFEWVTDDAGAARRQPYRLDKFMEVACAAMARRRREPSAAYTARLAEIHGMTS